MTSHSSQGLTSERVLVNMDTNVHPELINTRFAYVSVSRASQDVQIFTNNAATLAENLNKDISKASALDVAQGHNSIKGAELKSVAVLSKIPGAGPELAL